VLDAWRTLDDPTRFALLFVVVAWLLVLVGLRRRVAVPWIAAVAFLPVPGVALFSRQFGLVGWHGFMHGSSVFRMMENAQLPPEDPLFAGGALRYPWVEGWIVAKLSQATGLNVHWLTLGGEVVAYGFLLVAGGWLASQVSRNRTHVALAILFTGFGISVLHVGLLAEPFQRAVPGLWLESRVVPLDKFASITAMPWGYASFAVAAAAAVALACGGFKVLRLLCIVAACTLIAALVHPLSWACLLPFQGLVGLVLLFGSGTDRLRCLGLAVAVLTPSLLALPYLHAVGLSESSDGWTGLTRPASLWWAKLEDLAAYLSLLGVVLYTERARLRTELRAGNRALWISLLAITGYAVAYLAVRFPGRNEYKFLLAMVPPGAGLLAFGVKHLLERHYLAAATLIGLLLTPGAVSLGYRPWFKVTEPCHAAGRYLRAFNPDADALYQWIARETPPEAVFISSDLGIPPLGRRSLYSALDAPWQGRDGWGLERYKLRQWHVRRSDQEMARRHQNARQVLDAPDGPETAQLLAAIQADVPNRPLFIEARDGATRARLERSPQLVRRFSSVAGAIYGLRSESVTTASLPTSPEPTGL
jgi:hypothetical protein